MGLPMFVVKNARIFDLATPHTPPLGDIVIEHGRIAEIVLREQPAGAPRLSASPQATIIDARGKLVMPGFFNAHYHSHDVFLKGCFDPSILEYWALNALPRAHPPRSDREVRLRTLFGAAECIRNGITTIQDMVTLFPLTRRQIDVMCEAYADVGIRVVLGLQCANVSPLDTVPYWRELLPAELQSTLAGPPPPANAVAPIELLSDVLSNPRPAPLLTWAIAPLSPERCSPGLLADLIGLARQHDLPVYTHIYISRAEALNARRSFAAHGGSLIDYLGEMGLLDVRLTLARGVWLDGDEIATIAKSGVSVVLNLLSNLKTKNGVPPIRDLHAGGVNLGLGCDNCSCSDAQNIFQAMRLFTYLAAVSDPAEGPPDAVDAIRVATVGGARTAGLDNEIGAIRRGMHADLVVMDTTDPVYVPFNSAARQLLYGEGGRSVETVIVDGKIVMQDRVLRGVDEARLRAQIDEIMPGFRTAADAVRARADKLRPYITKADRRIWGPDVGMHRYIRK